MNHYFSVYKQIIRLNWLTLITYRSNFINSMISSVTWGAFLFISMYLLTSNSQRIYGWSQAELLLTTSCYSVMIGIFHCFLSKNFESLSRKIRYGELDIILLKPMDAQFMVSTENIGFTALSRVVLGIFFVFFFANLVHVQISTREVVGFFGLLCFSVVLLYSIWMSVTSLLFFFPRMKNIVDLMYSVTGMTRFPGEMYHRLGPIPFIFFFPLTLVLFTPVKFILHRGSIADGVVLIVVSIVFFLCTRTIWLFSLRRYSSAGS